MGQSMAETPPRRHRVNGEIPRRMAKAVLPSGENGPAFQLEIGRCLDDARRRLDWSVDRLAQEPGKDSKQVARWMRGEERTQVDAVFAVAALRVPFVICLARLAQMQVEETVTIRRMA